MLEKLGKLLLKSPRVQMLEMLSKFFRLFNVMMMIKDVAMMFPCFSFSLANIDR